MEQGDKQTSKRSSKSSEGIRKTSRVVDMSWAADYLDDTWENEHAAKGAYDTQVIPPLKKYMPADAEGVNPLSTTQEFKAVPGEGAAGSRAARTAVPAAAADQGRETDEAVKIRDALTDQTVASMEEAHAVRRAAAFYDLREELDERPAIRDALSGAPLDDRSRASGSDNMDKVRQALASSPKMPAFMSRKDSSANVQTSASGMKTGTSKPVSAGTVQERKPEPVKDTKKPQEAQKMQKAQEAQEEQAKTIVASKDVMNVRKAASGAGAFRVNNVEELFQNDDIDLEPEGDDWDDQYEDITDYDDDMDSYDDYDEDADLDERDDSDAYRDPDSYYEPDDDYDDRRAKRRRRPDKYYYGYKEPRNPLRFIPLVLVVAICVLGFIVAMQICHDVPLNASDYSKVKYTVEADLTDEQLSQDLQALGIIDNPLVFRLRCKFYDADYVPGTYELSPCYSTEKIINILSGYTYGTDE